ncbi:DUF6573 family protein [Streptomyces sp. NPDC059447]|uniref:DUF6573 family protein n=1 Tax=Streptomyces sp. NPDC059447 TaxID=3346834 RepID=UPI003692A02B
MNNPPVPGSVPSDPAQPENLIGTLFGVPVPVIHAYTRAQAIEDGALMKVPEAIAEEAGFQFPLALTAAAWADCVAWTDDDSKAQTPQDESGRLWDVVYMTRFAIKKARGSASEVDVCLYRVPRDGKTVHARPVRLKCVCGPGDNAEPVLTIMQPDES